MDPDHLHIHVYTNPDPRMDEVLTLLRTTHRLLEDLMAKYETTNALIQDMNEETNRLASLVADALAQMQGGLSPTEADAVIAALTPVRDRLRAIGANPVDPLPPVTP